MSRSNTHSRPGRRRGGVMAMVIGLIVLVLLVGLGWLVLRGDDSAAAVNGAGTGEIVTVQRTSFDVTIPASGELAALRQVEIRNPLESRDAIITFIVGEGETVREGDVLVRFADEEIRTEIADQEVTVLNARNSLVSAQNELSITKSANLSNLSQAQTDLELAQITFEQWSEGDVKSKRQELDLAIETAKRNLDRLTEKFEQSKTLVEEGFISRDEYKRDEIAMIEAEAELETAKLNIEVYESFQYRRDQKEKQAAVDRATEELERVKQQNAAELERAQSDVEAKQGELDNRTTWLEYWKSELEKTIIRAPGPGLVVYASSLGGGHRDDSRTPPEIGAEVRRNDRIIVLPDISQMTADLKVHESMSGKVQKGQRARIVCDTIPGKPIMGTVMSVSVMAETGSWRDPNRRDYTVRIHLDNEAIEGLELKPSLRCRGEIFIDRVSDVLSVPVQAVFHRGGKSFVYVPFSDGFAQREVEAGRASATRQEIIDGLREGDQVLTREPEEAEIVSRLEFDTPGEGFAPTIDDPAQRQQPQQEPGGRGMGMGGGDGGSMLSHFDSNGDGRLEPSEVPEQMQDAFDRIDSNGDGFIDESEAAAMRGPGGRPRGGEGAGGWNDREPDADDADDGDDRDPDGPGAPDRDDGDAPPPGNERGGPR